MMSVGRHVSRRDFLRLGAGGLLGVSSVALWSGCSTPAAPPAAPAATQAPKPSGSQAAQPTQAPAVTNKPITLRFMTTESDPPSQKIYQEAVDEYRTTHPNVTIEMEYVGHDDKIKKVAAAVPAKSIAEITNLTPEETIDFAKMGLLAPVDDVIDAAGGRAKWQPGGIIGATHEGKMYGVPYAGATYKVLWYREDLFQKEGIKPPTTRDEWLAAAQALTKDTDGDGKVDQFGVSIPGGKSRFVQHHFLLWLWQASETVFDKDLNLVLGGEGSKKSLEFYKQMAQYAPPGFASYSYMECIDAYASGKAATLVYAGRVLTTVNDNAPQLLEVTKGTPLPKGPNDIDLGYCTFDYYNVFNEQAGVSKEAQEAAKDFVKFMTVGKPATKFALSVPGHLIPAHLDTLNDPELWTGNPLMKTFEQEIRRIFDTDNTLMTLTEAGAKFEGGKVTPVTVNPLYAALDTPLTVPVMVQKVILEGQSVDEALDWGIKEINRLVEDFKNK